jgi:hypothetical protein
MPCQDEALKDLSSMPPVSVTMQPRNLPAVDAVLEEELGALLLVELELGAEVAEPHAASSATAPTAATVLSVAFTDTSYGHGSQRCEKEHRTSRRPGPGRSSPAYPARGCAKANGGP